jgi:hypothetical protein
LGAFGGTRTPVHGDVSPLKLAPARAKLKPRQGLAGHRPIAMIS